MFTTIRQFTATDGSGKPVVLILEQQLVPGQALESSGDKHGIMRLRTVGGDSVTRIERGKYRLDQFIPPVELTSDEPNAF